MHSREELSSGVAKHVLCPHVHIKTSFRFHSGLFVPFWQREYSIKGIRMEWCISWALPCVFTAQWDKRNLS